VLLECALFDTKVVRQGRRRLDMSTDASYRFERGVDPGAMERAVRRAIEIIVATAGGDVAAVAPCVDAGVPDVAPVHVRTARVARLLGVPMSAERIAGHLTPIGFAVEQRSESDMRFRVPGHRRYDVAREEDLIEEIARREGYDAFPDEVRPFRPSVVPDDPLAILEDRLRTMFVARGFLEARSSPFAPEAEGDVALMLPLSTAESRLRRALLPGLIHRLEGNFNRGARDVRVFEIGTTFAHAENDRPRESTRVAAVMTGARAPLHWSAAPTLFDIWDLRGTMDAAAAAVAARVEPDAIPCAPFEIASFAIVTAGGERIGAGGRVPDRAIDAPAWAEAVFALEFTITSAMAVRPPVEFRALPARPPVDRDLALVVPVTAAAAGIEHTIRDTAGTLLESIEPFDVYAGEGVPAGTRSIAFRLRFRAGDRTLTDAEVDTVIDRILARLREEHHVERR
jgi:phenylalanyl-tRNA synthetase beta chain